jgi:hypothetical protein
MAKAAVTSTVVERRKVVSYEDVEVRKINLELTEGDADFLLAVLNLIGGNAKNSPRKYGDRISAALKEATGLSADDTDAYELVAGNGSGSRGAIYFNDYPDPTLGSHTSKKRARGLPAEQKFSGSQAVQFDLSDLLSSYKRNENPFQYSGNVLGRALFQIPGVSW